MPEVMASFPGDATLPSSSLPASHLSTPPIAPSASQPPSPPKSNSPEQPVQPEASQDFEVNIVTIYLNLHSYPALLLSYFTHFEYLLR